jgi:hypothetical protein
MLRSKKLATLASVLLAAAASSTFPAGATPVSFAAKAAAVQTGAPNLQAVAWRGGRGYGDGPHYGHWRGHRGWGPGIVGGLVAGALIAGAIREGRADDADFERCEDRYRSFDRASGTYLGSDGERHVCPYLM